MAPPKRCWRMTSLGNKMVLMLAAAWRAGERPERWVISWSDLKSLVRSRAHHDEIVLGDGWVSFLDLPITLVIGVTLPRLESRSPDLDRGDCTPDAN